MGKQQMISSDDSPLSFAGCEPVESAGRRAPNKVPSRLWSPMFLFCLIPFVGVGCSKSVEQDMREKLTPGLLSSCTDAVAAKNVPLRSAMVVWDRDAKKIHTASTSHSSPSDQITVAVVQPEVEPVEYYLAGLSKATTLYRRFYDVCFINFPERVVIGQTRIHVYEPPKKIESKYTNIGSPFGTTKHLADGKEFNIECAESITCFDQSSRAAMVRELHRLQRMDALERKASDGSILTKGDRAESARIRQNRIATQNNCDIGIPGACNGLRFYDEKCDAGDKRFCP